MKYGVYGYIWNEHGEEEYLETTVEAADETEAAQKALGSRKVVWVDIGEGEEINPEWHPIAD